MAKAIFSFIVFCLICLHLAYCGSLKNAPRNITTIMLDGKRDCGIVNSQKVIPFFKAHLCQEYLPPYKDDIFTQREHLPCVGIYDALYNLCEFDLEKVDLMIPELFNNSKTFCAEASKVYAKLNFTHPGHDASNWSSSVKRSMMDGNICDNMCIIFNQINPLCMNMVVSSNEYLRLKALEVMSQQSGKVQEVNTNITNPVEPPQSHPENQFVQQPGPSISALSEPKDNELPKPNEKITSTVPSKAVTSGDVPAKIALNIDPTKVGSVDSASNLVNVKPDSQSPVAPRNDLDKQPKAEVITSDQPSDDIPSPSLDSNGPVVPQTDQDSWAPNELDLNPEPDQKGLDEVGKPAIENKVMQETLRSESDYARKENFDNSEDPFTFSYFATVTILCFVAYFLFHYKNKLFALAIEGRKSRNSRGRGRPSSANYSKLQSNLEEAITSNVTAPSATHVLY